MSASPVNNGAAAAAAPTSVNEARDPSGFLSEIIGAPVTVKLNSGVVYRGVLASPDPLLYEALRTKNR
jgi:U6 snRNA-associated Sm-like protein LSm6